MVVLTNKTVSMARVRVRVRACVRVRVRAWRSPKHARV